MHVSLALRVNVSYYVTHRFSLRPASKDDRESVVVLQRRGRVRLMCSRGSAAHGRGEGGTRMEISPGVYSIGQLTGRAAYTSGRVHAFLLDDGESLTLV